MVNSYPSQPNEKIWKSGDSLDFAWFGNAHENLQNQYRDAKGEGSTNAIRMLMEADVRAELADGSLIAFGYRIPPNLSEQPETIPTFMFASHAVIINWDESIITGLSRRYESVTVTRHHVSANESESPVSQTPLGKKRGPKGYDDILFEAVASLKDTEENFADWTQEKQVMAVQDKAAAMHPGKLNGGKPGRSTVYRYLSNNPI